ncbi:MULTISPECIES: Cof-type HAD-IIB family hydrolase [unclassified Oceanobacillus]|uniref:Cof-type HAD-IIB family hydrolase n=1 Tax=unclassified Oceanobacillus TaxID=2630292 RepID=UPI00300E6150
MKLIAIDLDGTMLSTNGKINVATRKAVREAQAQGNEIVLASGREFHDIRGILEESDLNCPIISSNGALIYSSDQVIQNITLSSDIVKELVHFSEQENLYYEVYTNEGIYIEKNRIEKLYNEISYLSNSDMEFDKVMAIHMVNTQKEQKSLISVPELKELNYDNFEINKFFILSFDLNKHTMIYKKYNGREGIKIITSDIQKFEFASSGVSKGNALQKYAQLLSIPRENIIAIGDNLNDLSMFKVSGFSIAMGNAVSKIKKHADSITDSCDNDGVAKAIQRHVIN